MNHETNIENRSFLIVDDEAFSRDIVRRMLAELSPRQLDTAENGNEALRLLREQRYDCVVTDFSMKPINGLELLKMIRTGTHGIHRHLPVVMLTGHSDAELLGTALALDAQAFLAKPVSFNTLCDRVARVIADPGPIRPAIAYSVVPTPVRSQRPETREMPKSMALQRDFEQRAQPEPTESPAPVGPQSPAEAKRREMQYPLTQVPSDSILSRGFMTRNGTMLLGPDSVLTRRMLNRLRDVTALESVVDNVWIYVDDETPEEEKKS